MKPGLLSHLQTHTWVHRTLVHGTCNVLGTGVIRGVVSRLLTACLGSQSTEGVTNRVTHTHLETLHTDTARIKWLRLFF
jgi:hypothetical protein